MSHDPMYTFFKIFKDTWVNRAGLTLKDVQEIKEENIDFFHVLRGKLLAARLRTDPEWLKLRKTIYSVDDNPRLAYFEARKHFKEEYLNENDERTLVTVFEGEGSGSEESCGEGSCETYTLHCTEDC